MPVLAPTIVAALPVEGDLDSVAAVDAYSAASSSTSNGFGGAKPVLTVGLLDTTLNPFDSLELRQTVLHLEKSLPQYAWKTLTIPMAEAPARIASNAPDFLFAPAGFAALLQAKSGIDAFKIATRRRLDRVDAVSSVGAVIVQRKGVGRAPTLEALAGSRVVAAFPTAIDGWLAVEGEILRAGLDPEDLFGEVLFLNNAFPDVLSALEAGSVDAAIVPTCLIETLQTDGLYDAASLEVVNPKGLLGFGGPRTNGEVCARSTELYPDLSLLALPGAPERAVRQVTIALLSEEGHATGLPGTQAPERGYEWQTNVSEAKVDALFRELRWGPYQYLRDMSPSALYARYRSLILTVISVVCGVVLLLVANELRLRTLLRRRTRAWLESHREAECLREEAEAARIRLASFERKTIVEQLSGMIAHEVNTPIGSIRAYVSILQRKAAMLLADDRTLSRAVVGIDREATRIAEIIARVREHGRIEAEHTACRLDRIVNRSLRAFVAESPEERANLVEETEEEGLVVEGDALELELLALNLLRNGANAALEAGKAKKGAVRVTTRALGDAVFLIVENDGAPISEETLRALRDPASPSGSSSAGDRSEPANGQLTKKLPDTAGPRVRTGLGLGLSICRGIAESHGASIAFEALITGGLRVIVRFARRGAGVQSTSRPALRPAASPTTRNS